MAPKTIDTSRLMHHCDNGKTPSYADEPIRVLVSWTPSSRSNEALELAAWLGHNTRIKVRVVSAFVQPWHSASLQKLGGKYKKWFKREATACEKAVEEALEAAGLPRHQWADKFSVLTDGPSKPALLTEAAEEFGADLVLLGAHQSAAKGRFLAGSTADALLHYSPTPLGLTPRKVRLSKHGVTRVNFAFTDANTQKDDPALVAAARLADHWQVPLRILAFSSTGLVDAPMNDKLDVAAELTSAWREHSLALLDVAREHLHEEFDDLEVSTDIGCGNGWSGAVDSLKWKKGDLMCLGSSPQGPIARVFIGSTATELLPHLGVPILALPTLDCQNAT